jgi:hypothetical protein
LGNVIKDGAAMNSRNYQQGLATVIVAIVLLVIMTLMVLFAARVGVFDVRMAANEARYKEAFVTAEAGLDYSTQRFSSEFTRLYDGTDAGTAGTSLATIVANSQVTSNTEPDGTSPEPGDPYFTVTVTDTGATYGSVPIYEFVSTGIGSDGTGTATVRRQITMASVFGGTVPDVPVIVGGAVGTGGNFNVVANPNGAGEGVPVSIWSSDDISGTNSSATCHFEFYDGNNAQCSNPSGNTENISMGGDLAALSPLVSHDPSVPDLLPNDPNFPSDLFAFIFGVPTAQWALKYAEADANGQAVTSCAAINAAGVNAGVNFPLWWVSGECTISGTIGSIANPVIIVVDDNAFKGTGNNQVNGIVYLFDNPTNAAQPSAQLGGTMEIRGSYVSDVGGAAMQGSYSVVYDPNLVASFQSNGSNYNFAYIPASWRDF